MQNRFDTTKTFADDLELRVYTSNLLGIDQDLVLHGGGNTSLKTEDTLYVKGSGWDLSTIKKEGFSPVDLDVLQEMATLDSLSDSDMVAKQRAALRDTSAPNPSIEAILHAIIPYKFVDHTHADAVVTISNSINGEEIIKELYKDYLIVPYIMPGFILAKKVYEMTKGNFDWERCKGIILHHHGIFTFDDDGKRSYDKMIDSVAIAEEYLNQNAPLDVKTYTPKNYDITKLQKLIEEKKEHPVVLKPIQTPLALTYASGEDLFQKVTRGVLTPEHIIRTKREPLVIEDENFEAALQNFEDRYRSYFERYAKDEVMLSPTPNYIVLKDFGLIAIGKNEKEASIIADIITHTAKAVLQADKLGGYRSINEEESFKMEYWELEQAKLKGK
ncbi:MAG: oxidoreductase [Epsilonproteobacteria bacterium]|nr:oxidoreductase [Campylobacterota bacterium]